MSLLRPFGMGCTLYCTVYYGVSGITSDNSQYCGTVLNTGAKCRSFAHLPICTNIICMLPSKRTGTFYMMQLSQQALKMISLSMAISGPFSWLPNVYKNGVPSRFACRTAHKKEENTDLQIQHTNMSVKQGSKMAKPWILVLLE